MSNKSRLNLYIVTVLTLIIVTETAFFVMQYNNLQQIRHAYAVSEDENTQLKTELEETKTKLSRQEELFNQILKEKDSLNAELNSLRTEIRQSEDLLNRTKTEKQVLSDELRRDREELAAALEKLRLLEGKVYTLEEGKQSLEAKLSSLRELRSRIRELKRDTFLKKVEAQKEIDRIKLEKGNRGLVIKNGQSTLTKKRGIELEKIIVTVPPQQPK